MSGRRRSPTGWAFPHRFTACGLEFVVVSNDGAVSGNPIAAPAVPGDNPDSQENHGSNQDPKLRSTRLKSAPRQVHRSGAESRECKRKVS